MINKYMSSKQITPRKQLEKYIDTYLTAQKKSKYTPDELEIRFGTNYKNKITKIQFNNVMKKLNSLGWQVKTQDGDYHLNIQSFYLSENLGKYVQSNIRVEIWNLPNIQHYCETNDLKTLLNKNGALNFVVKTRKKHNENMLKPIDFKNFEFRVNYKVEKKLKPSYELVENLVEDWKNNKKVFRLLKRFTFQHRKYPFKFDLSIVRSSNYGRVDGKFGMIPEYSIDKSNVFHNSESYEIELEFTPYNSIIDGISELEKKVETSCKLVFEGVKMALSGLQESNYPISIEEKDYVLTEYLKTIRGEKELKNARDRFNKLIINTSDFVGPSSISLTMNNIVKEKEQSMNNSINSNYLVTEKADGIRKLLFIAKNKKVYLIDMNMQVQFTGGICTNQKLSGTILDGEHILHDKEKNYINLFAAFDIYFKSYKDVREYPFVKTDSLNYVNKKMDKTIFRYNELDALTKEFNMESITKNSDNVIDIAIKEFYGNVNIFDGCKTLLQEMSDDLIEYETDGLIFHPVNKSVGIETLGFPNGKRIPPKKTTWMSSYKWKPPEFNTVDFLITTKKDENGKDLIKNKFNEGTNLSEGFDHCRYKTLVCRVGFDERYHGYINPFEDIIQDNIPEYSYDNRNNYKPVPFHPTNPEPNYPVHLTNIKIERNNNIDYLLTENKEESFEDETIVEFRFDKNAERGWQWIPIRVRHDKTAQYRAGKKNYGNNYTTAQGVWESIHNPITEEMLKTGEGIPDEIIDDNVYYNKSGKRDVTYLLSLRDFHNKYVKKKLIQNVSKKGDILIDMSVGKGGDLSKWIKSRLSFVLGIDYSQDNIENRINGVCARYLNDKKKTRIMPDAIFLTGDSSKNIRSGEAAKGGERSEKIMKAIFGNGPKDEKQIGFGVYKKYGIGEEGFNIVSNQFSIHYFFKDIISINNFVRNVSECCKVGGHFIGTTYNGEKIYNKLEQISKNESINIMEGEKKLWEITKRYENLPEGFKDDPVCLGLQIDVYQESINKVFPEYLVNFEYFTSLLEHYGFVLLTNEESNKIGFDKSLGSFENLYDNMSKETKQYKHAKKYYGKAGEMNINEKSISFLNNYFIYRKIRDVDTESVFNTQIKEIIKKPKKKNIKKLGKKIRISRKNLKKGKKKLQIK